MLKDISKIVSRETIGKLKRYEELLKEVNKKINLVSRKDINNLWERHIIDSVYGYIALKNYMGKAFVSDLKSFLDIGSGGGLPAIPMSLLLDDAKGFLYESIQKKCKALEFFKKELILNLDIIPERIENTKIKTSSLIMARGVCKLEKLLEYSNNRLEKKGVALFWKGEIFQDEINSARKIWNFDVDVVAVKDIIGEGEDRDRRVLLFVKNIRHQ